MKQCIVCQSAQFTPIYNNTLLQCDACEFITANLQVNEQLLKEIYSENYFKGEEYLDYVQDQEGLQKNFRQRLRYILKLYNQSSLKASLEIGAAYGFFGDILKHSMPSLKYIGLDIVPEAIDYGKKNFALDLLCADYLQQDFQQKFTDVFMWDVIEHLPQPDLFLDKIASEQEPGGRLYITTGDIGALVPRIKKQKWRLIHPPSHLHYFSKATIAKLLETRGYLVKQIKYPMIYRNLRLIYYSLFILNKKPNKIISFFYKIIPNKMFIPFNTFDIMFVVAEKSRIAKI